MATSSTRQRKLARAKLDRQLARRAEQERRKRQLRAVAAGVTTLLVVALGVLWAKGVFNKKPQPPVAANDCTYTIQNVSGNPNLKDTSGTPRTSGIASTGTSKMTAQFGTGTLEIELNRELAKCAAESLAYLSSSGFYNGTKCHELTKDVNGQSALRCGDPSGSGNGGAYYTWVPENVPPKSTVDPSAAPSASPVPGTETIRYPEGTVAMQPGMTGSQFLIFYKDSPAPAGDYSIVGRVVSGLDVIKKIAEAGTVDNGTQPKNDVVISSLTVVPSDEPSSAPSSEPSTQPSSSATPSS